MNEENLKKYIKLQQIGIDTFKSLEEQNRIYDFTNEINNHQEIIDCISKQISEKPVSGLGLSSVFIHDDGGADDLLKFTLHCKRCGHALEIGEDYCMKCGQKIDKN